MPDFTHSHGVGYFGAFVARPTAVYVHFHPYEGEHDHPELPALEKEVLAKERRPHLYSVRQDGSDLTDMGEC